MFCFLGIHSWVYDAQKDKRVCSRCLRRQYRSGGRSMEGKEWVDYDPPSADDEVMFDVLWKKAKDDQERRSAPI